MAPKKRILFDDEADDSYSDEEEAEDDDEDDSSLAEFVVNDSDEESAETFQDSNESDDDYNIARPFRAAVAAGTAVVTKKKLSKPASKAVVPPTTPPSVAGFSAMFSPPRSAEPAKRGRGRPPSASKISPETAERLPGHSHYPVNDFSLTISKIKTDVPIGLLDIIYDEFYRAYCLKGGISTEVGQRAHNLHLQGVFRIKYPKDPPAVAKLTKIIKDVIKSFTKSLSGYRVLLKPLGCQQTFVTMVGYITKDAGQAHFKTRFFNVDREELDKGKREHASMISSWDDEKKIITLKNFFPECYRFNKRCFSPFVVAIDYTLLYMIQSKQYIFTPDFILCYRKIDFKEANVLWKLMHVPDSASIDQIRRLVFDSRSYDSFREQQEYFIPGMAFDKSVEQNRSTFFADAVDTNNVASDDVSFSIDRNGHNNAALRNSSSQFDQSSTNNSSSNEFASQTDCSQSKVNRLVNFMRASTSSGENRVRNYPTDEDNVLSLNIPHHSHSADFSCPDSLDEMMKIVRDARSRTSQTHALYATLYGEHSNVARTVLDDDQAEDEDNDDDSLSPPFKRVRSTCDEYDMYCNNE